MIDEKEAREAGERDPARGRPRGTVLLGFLAGTIGIGCCVTPAVLALLGLASASTAIELGNRLYGQWGWAFKIAGAAAALAAVALQRRRATRCAPWRRPSTHAITIQIAAAAMASYLVLYAATKALATLARST